MADASAFVADVKGKPSSTVAMVVKQALGRSDIYFFGQLLHQPEVQALGGSDSTAPVLRVLELFTYGTFADVAALPDAARSLVTPNMMLKLKHLSLMSLAAHTRLLTYATLHAALQIADVRELEDMIIDCITEGLLNARLDQRGSVVEVHEVAARDVKLEQLPTLIERLKGWSAQCAAVNAQLTGVSKTVNSRLDFEAALTKSQQKRESELMDACKKELIEMKDTLDDGEFGALPRGGAGRAGAARPGRVM